MLWDASMLFKNIFRRSDCVSNTFEETSVSEFFSEPRRTSAEVGKPQYASSAQLLLRLLAGDPWSDVPRDAPPLPGKWPVPESARACSYFSSEQAQKTR